MLGRGFHLHAGSETVEQNQTLEPREGAKDSASGLAGYSNYDSIKNSNGSSG